MLASYTRYKGREKGEQGQHGCRGSGLSEHVGYLRKRMGERNERGVAAKTNEGDGGRV